MLIKIVDHVEVNRSDYPNLTAKEIRAAVKEAVAQGSVKDHIKQEVERALEDLDHEMSKQPALKLEGRYISSDWTIE